MAGSGMSLSTAIPGSKRRLGWVLLLLLLAAAVVYAVMARVHYHWNWSVLWQYRQQFLTGWLLTVGICAMAMVLSIVLGFVLMLARMSAVLPLRMAAGCFVEMVRGSPLLVQLLLGYYMVATALAIDSPLLVGTLLLGGFQAAYLAEIFRGAVQSVGASQWEAARAVGFDLRQTYRFVIIPQALRRVMPAVAGEMVSLVKSSSLLSVIGVEELVQRVRVINSANYTALEGYIPLALAYLLLTLPLSALSKALERKLAAET
jgi:polar amino acid transport system permease protein